MFDFVLAFSAYKSTIISFCHFICSVLLFFFYFCRHNFEANHNKDYSVVKTSKAGQQCLVFFSSANHVHKCDHIYIKSIPNVF